MPAGTDKLMATDRPNILLLFTDQHRLSGLYGDTTKMRNLCDRLTDRQPYSYGQRTRYDALFLAGRIDETEYRAQPYRFHLGLRGCRKGLGRVEQGAHTFGVVAPGTPERTQVFPPRDNIVRAGVEDCRVPHGPCGGRGYSGRTYVFGDAPNGGACAGASHHGEGLGRAAQIPYSRGRMCYTCRVSPE